MTSSDPTQTGGRLRGAARLALGIPAAAVGLLLVLPLLVLLLPFAGVGWLSRRFASWLQADAVPQGDIMEFEPELGWRARARQRVRILDQNDDPHPVTTDADGWRLDTPLEDAEVVVLGDSFAFGDAIGDGEFFAALAEPRGRVKAIGAPGYNMVQGLLLLRRLAPRLDSRLVVWLTYLGNDLADNVTPEMDGYRTPFLRRPGGRGPWEIHREHLSPEPWPFPSRVPAHERFMEIATGGHLAERAYDAFDHLVTEADGLLRERGARLVVVSVPDLSPLARRWMEGSRVSRPDLAEFDPRRPDRELARRCEERGVPFLALADHLTAADYRTRDLHWNAAGHRKVARLVDELARVHAPGRPAAGTEASDGLEGGSIGDRAGDGRAPATAPRGGEGRGP